MIDFIEMDLSHAKAVFELEQKCFSDPWTYDNICYEIEGNPFSTGWLMLEGKKIVGFAFLWILFERADIADIAIVPEERNNGYGMEFLKFLEMEAIQKGCELFSLEVKESNQTARHLYEKFGFIETNRSKKYYSDGQTAIYMSTPIGGI